MVGLADELGHMTGNASLAYRISEGTVFVDV